MNPLRIGSRGSSLAIWQAQFIQAKLKDACRRESEIIRIHTSGDRGGDLPISSFNGKGVFIKEIEQALLERHVDLAVHSMKDVPTEIPDGLVFAAMPPRADVRDCLIPRAAMQRWRDLPAGARVGTSSLRRQSQLRALRQDWAITDLRGNVDTRLRKLDEGRFDAIILARAGVERLGLGNRFMEILPPEIMLPAVGQGALCIETRAEDAELRHLLGVLDDRETRTCVTAERALLARLEGGCQVPLGAWARIEDAALTLECCILAADGCDSIRKKASGPAEAPEKLGVQLAETLLEAGAGRLLQLAGRNLA